MLFLSFFSLPLLLLVSFFHFTRHAPSIRENGTDDPSFSMNRRVSIVERSTRHASSHDAFDVNEGGGGGLFFIISYSYSSWIRSHV